MELNDFLTDENLAQKGKWLKLDDAQLLIASSNNPKYRAAIRKNSAGVTKQKLKTNAKVQDEFFLSSLADAIFLDFKGITHNGVPLENTRENRIALLRAPSILDFVVEEMDNIANFQEEAAEAEAEVLGEQ